jgi:excisionase family DNA binding protein
VEWEVKLPARYLKAMDVAKIYGVTTRTVWSWVAAGLLPHHRIGKSVFFSAKDIDDTMDRNRYLGHRRCPAMG